MTRERWRAVARVEKAHGRRGEVVAVPTHGLAPLMRCGLELAVVPPELRGRRLHTVIACGDAAPGQLVSLEGVDDRGKAERLVGKTLLVRRSDLPQGWELGDVDTVVGLHVIDDRLGPIGRVDAVIAGGAGRIWVVRGERGEVLVPAVDAVVCDVDLGTRTVTTALPVGLAPWDGGVGHAL